MQCDIAVATRSLRVTIDEDKVAHIVFGPAGAMPVTDAASHAALGSIWSELDAHPDVRAILVHSEDKGFCAGGELSMVEGMLGSKAARTRVMREARDFVRGIGKVLTVTTRGVQVPEKARSGSRRTRY